MGIPRGFVGVVAMAFACTTAAASAEAPPWPQRPITMIIPFGAGSGIDVLGRIIAPAMAEKLGQPIVIENVGGAGGMTGTARVAKAAPDGYVFVLGNVGTHAVNQSLYPHPLYDAAQDFVPVAALADTPPVLIVRKDLPAEGLHDFVGYAKANRAKMQFGSPGAGSAAHLACALLNVAIGVDVTHVPYRGGGPAMQDLIAGRIDYQCPLVALARPHIESGQVRAIAALSARRSVTLAQVPTAQEQGLPGFEVLTWNALFFPKGTPDALVRRLHDAADAAVESPDIQARLVQIGAEPMAREDRSPEFLKKLVAREISKWSSAIKAAGLTAQ